MATGGEQWRIQTHGVGITTTFEAERSRLLVTARQDGTTGTGQVLMDPAAVRKMHDPHDLVALASFVQTADDYTKATIGGKLELISEQIRFLQAQARAVLEKAARDVELAHARCNFVRKPGNIYHLYRKIEVEANVTTSTYFSMLSPSDWHGKPPDEFLESYRLDSDMSWTAVKDIKERDRARRLDARLLGLEGAAHLDDGPLSLTFK